MIQQLYRFESARAKHRDAPMLPEREEYLSYLFQQGVGRSRLRSIALTLLNIVFYLDLKETRAVTRAELQQGSERWLAASIDGAAKIPSPALLRQFAFTARRWLRFQNQLCLETSSASSTENIVNEFTHYLTVVRGLAPETVRIYGSRASVFLVWSALRCTPVSDISLSDVDDFISMKKDSGYLPRSIVAFCGAIRMFFRYAESRGWNDSHITRNLRGPRIPRYGAAPKGPNGQTLDDC